MLPLTDTCITRTIFLERHDLWWRVSACEKVPISSYIAEKRYTNERKNRALSNCHAAAYRGGMFRSPCGQQRSSLLGAERAGGFRGGECRWDLRITLQEREF
jgi:hypothetical protein